MTIICYRDGIMAADSATVSDGIKVSVASKIAKSPDGSLAAAAGATSACIRFRQWVLDGMSGAFSSGEDEDNFGAIIVRPDGGMVDLNHKGVLIPISAPFTATGVAWRMAFGAMAAGASAQRACEIAVEYHDGCGGPVQCVSLFGAGA